MALGSTVDILVQLERLGFFDFVLPFLLIFAVVYGILTYSGIFGDNKGVHIIIALIFGLLSIRLPFFAIFLSEVSPRLGVGLGILLVLLILIGLFTPGGHQSTLGWILMGVGAVIFIVVIVQTFNALNLFGLGGSFTSSELIGWVVMIAILIGVVVAIVAGKGGGTNTGLAPLWKGISESIKGH